MAHTSAVSMRAFTKGRAAFDSDEEYRLALRGELDEEVREDFSYENGNPEDPDDGEDAGDLEDIAPDEAVKAELERFEEAIGGTHFLEVLEKFMKNCSGDCSGCEEPPYLPFAKAEGVEHIALFCHGSEALRLRYGAYGFEADRLEGDKVVQTWKGLDDMDVLNDWDDALLELAEEAELKEDVEDVHKATFFDGLAEILGDRKRGSIFLRFVMNAVDATENGKPAPMPLDLPDGRMLEIWGSPAKALLRSPGNVVKASWEVREFLDTLREIAWSDPECLENILGGGLREVWDALDDAWYDEDEDNLVSGAVEKFLEDVKAAEGDPTVGLATRDVAVCNEAGTGRVKMQMDWWRTRPDVAELAFIHTDSVFNKEDDRKTFSEVPLAFLRWWAFGTARGWW